MSLRIETSRRRGIDNTQEGELTKEEIRKGSRLAAQYPFAKVRTGPSTGYNCHGLTFLSRRAWLTRGTGVRTVLKDDQYEEIPPDEVMPGDIVIYYSESGDPNHSGVVVETDELESNFKVVSKWSYAHEFLHPLRHHPPYYGPRTVFYRVRR